MNGTPASVWTNVNKVRNRGAEFIAEQKDLFIPGLDVSNSVTYVDSRILSDRGFVSTTGTTAKGKHVPYVPNRRDAVQLTYHPTDELSFFVASRYSGKMYSTLDNSDSKSHVMGAFDKFFVVDTHVHYQFKKAVSADVGVDNLLNEKYFEYHPYPSNVRRELAGQVLSSALRKPRW